MGTYYKPSELPTSFKRVLEKEALRPGALERLIWAGDIT